MTRPTWLPENWRSRAEEHLEGREPDPTLAWGDALRLVHELRVHQIELEMQNEALHESRLEAEEGWARAQELSDELEGVNAQLEAQVARRTAQLERANADLQAFCHMISHELRAPLARMEGFSRMLAQADPAQVPHVAQRIGVSSQRMRAVIDSLLKLTRLALDEVEAAPVDLSLLVRQALDSLVAEGRAMPARVVIEPGVQAVGDVRLLEICVRNLLENALKFTARTAEAEVAFGVTTRDGQRAYFVRDNGAGFDSACAGQLFQAFGRLHRQEVFEGTGIGLTIVHKIIAKHGGTVWGESAPGAGATFLFTLP
jgi:light-regulated signal transduction histidine kinase (bacteriophytochrome)